MNQIDPIKILEKLDPEQRKAVEAPLGPVRIIAGAGTGKTRTLIHRIAFWDAKGLAPANRTLSVTHSNKSASELRHRLKQLGVQNANAQTFHAAAKKQLEESWENLSDFWTKKGFRSTFPKIITDSSKIRQENQYWIIRGIIQSILKESDIHKKEKRLFDTDLYQAINSELVLMRARMVSVDDYINNLTPNELIGSFTKQEFVKFYERYTKFKLSNNLIDFADVLELCIIMLKENQEIRLRVQSLYDHFLVDEYQDNDPVQDELLSVWLGNRNSICVVGDPRQTIYSFKGSDPSLLNEFEHRFAGCVSVELVRNYRSTPQIVEWANRLMQSTSASGGAKSKLVSMEKAGPLPVILELDKEVAEQREVAEKVKALIANTKIPNSQVAILLRINSNIPIYRQSLKRLGIPSKSPGDTFWEDVLPVMKSLQSTSSESIDGISALHNVLSELGWNANDDDEESYDPQSLAKRDNAEALVSLALSLPSSEIVTPLMLAQSFARMRDEARDDHNHDAVTVTTIHKAKGMEWEAVILPRFVEGVLPISFARKPSEVDEERRLAYVAITRARKYLLLSWASSYVNSFGNTKNQSRSRFLGLIEEPEKPVDITKPKSRETRNENRIRLTEPLSVGNRVNNIKYGLGTVINIDGESVIIDFGILGKKKFKKTSSTIERL